LAFSWIRLNLGFLLRENFLLYSSYLPLRVPNWVVICPHHGAKVVAPGSTQSWGRLRWLHHQRLCGSVIPAFGLQGYIIESQLIVIGLLVDRSCTFGLL
jgi:hypothetical protein